MHRIQNRDLPSVTGRNAVQLFFLKIAKNIVKVLVIRFFLFLLGYIYYY